MKRLLHLAAVATLTLWGCSAPGTGHAMASEYRILDPALREKPPELVQLLKMPEFAGGYWVNQDDVLYFQGTTSDLNAFLARYGGMPSAGPLQVLRCPGKGAVRYPWDRQTTQTAAAAEEIRTTAPAAAAAPAAGRWIWKVEILNRSWRSSPLPIPEGHPAWKHQVAVTIWTGGGLPWNEIQVPPGVMLLETPTREMRCR